MNKTLENIVQITDVNSKEFLKAMNIYFDAFPAMERHSLNNIKNRVDSRNEDLFYLTEQDEIIGIALIWNLHYEDFMVLDYFAIDRFRRSLGYGKYFLKELLGHFLVKNKTLVAEVEYYKSENFKSAKVKRVKFYKDVGFKEIVDFVYFMPQINNQAAVKMVLLLSNNYSKNFIDQKILRGLVNNIYTQLYYETENSLFLKSKLDSINLLKYHLE
jgi:GNAT superfamily N-acetyltransferase